ncbi:MAG: hypothetical protein JNK29_13205 [Anaerolineales bacterium]|nr:hypothetical protein [Anaerolineales bacterium]
MFSSRLRFGAVLAGLAAASLACTTLLPTPPPAPTAIRVPTGGTPRVITSTPPPTFTAAPTEPAPSDTASPAPTATRPATATRAASATPTTGASAEAPAGAAPAGPAEIRGRFQVSNDFVIASYMVEHAVALVDLHGFVLRDPEWPVPTDSQVLGFMQVDLATDSGSYDLNLPVRPEGEASDVDNDGQRDAGVQVFAVAYWPNLAGGPFSEGDDPSFGWPTYLASIRTDSENDDEVIGGRIVVWASDDQQGFPTGFGADGRLFTADDPAGPLPAGYSVIDLDRQPFAVLRPATAEADLYEPQDIALKDFSAQSYSEAFQSLTDLMAREWAFNGLPEKRVDWKALTAAIAPRVAQAEQDQDPAAFWRALFDFTHAIPDGHVGLGGGPYESQAFSEVAGAGYGFAIRQLEGGEYAVVYVTPGGPAEAAGLAVGATVLQFGGQPLEQALRGVTPFAGPFSQTVFERYQQARYLLRAAEGVTTTVTFRNPGGASSQTVTLAAVPEQDSFRFTSLYRGYVQPELPLEYHFLESGFGYINISSYSDDLNLIVRLFERALQTFEANGVTSVIIDLRYNSGGNPLGLAGFLTDQTIPLGQEERYSEATGQFEPVGPPRKILPNQTQYRFDQIAVLVGPACFSACEAEAYGFSQVPGAVVVGFYPSAGVYADVARGQVLLPEGLSLQFSTDRIVRPDGRLFLEGTGVVPTRRVPLTLDNLLSPDDVVLREAEAALRGEAPASRPSATPTLAPSRTPAGPATPTARPGTATRTPPPTQTGRATPTGTPGGGLRLGTPAEAEAALQAGTAFLEDLARESYDTDQLSQAGQVYTYTIALRQDEDLIWMNGWCATTDAILRQNFQNITLTFTLDGEPVDGQDLALFEGPAGDMVCRMYYTVVSNWPAGPTRLENVVTFKREIDDGQSKYPAGTHRYVYIVSRP